MKKTVNELMVLSKAVRGRLAELSNLRTQSSTRESYAYSDGANAKKTIEPLYDVKDLDRRCCELENFIMEVDSKIKQSNAMTLIEIEADVKKLLEPLT